MVTIAENNDQPFVTIGGDSSGATTAFKQVQDAARKTQQAVKREGSLMASIFKSSFGALKSILTGVFGILKRVTGLLIGFAWRAAVAGIVSITAALGLSYRAWLKEAQAQEKIGAILKANVKNYKSAGKEIDSIIRRTLRTTNYGDDEIRNVFGVMTAMGGQKGFNAGKRLINPILDVAAARGESPEQIAELIARALHRGEIGRLNMIMPINKRMFARDKVGAIEQALMSQVSPNAAEKQRRANPLPALMNNITEIMETFGRITAKVLNPAIEALAIKANDLASKFEGMSAREVWGSIKEYGIDAMQTIRAAGVATFQSLMDWIKTTWASIKEDIKGPDGSRRRKGAYFWDLFKWKDPNPPVPYRGQGAPMQPPPSMPGITPVSSSGGGAFSPGRSITPGTINKSGLGAGASGMPSAFRLMSGAGGGTNSWQENFEQNYQSYTGRPFGQGPVGQSISAFVAAVRGARQNEYDSDDSAFRSALRKNPNAVLRANLAREQAQRSAAFYANPGSWAGFADRRDRANDLMYGVQNMNEYGWNPDLTYAVPKTQYNAAHKRAIDSIFIDRARGAMATL